MKYKCSKCGCELILGENFWVSFKNKSHYECKECYYKARKERRKRNKQLKGLSVAKPENIVREIPPEPKKTTYHKINPNMLKETTRNSCISKEHYTEFQELLNKSESMSVSDFRKYLDERAIIHKSLYYIITGLKGNLP